MISRRIKSNSYKLILMLVWIYYIITIFDCAYIKGIFATPDSVGYLREAEALRNGYGFNFNGMAGGDGWFASWPIGYPALIALFSMIINVHNIYLCSKIVSILMMGFVLILLYVKYREDSWLLAVLLLNRNLVAIYWFTWSETAFFPVLILYIIILSNIIESEKTLLRDYIFLSFVMILAFLFRYFGIILVLFSGLCWLALHVYNTKEKSNDYRDLYIKKELIEKEKCLFCSCAFSSILEMIYLIVNRILNGRATGVERREFIDDPKVLRNDLFKAIMNEIRTIIPLKSHVEIWDNSLFQYIMIITILIGIILTIIARNKIDNATLFVLFGLFYYIVFIIIRFHSSMDTFGFRFFTPATLMILIGMGLIFIERIALERLSVLGVIAGCAIFLSSAYTVKRDFDYLPKGIEYIKTYECIMDDLKEIPSNSIILNYSGDMYAGFIRPDVIFSGKITEDDKYEDIIRKYGNYSHIFIDTTAMENQYIPISRDTLADDRYIDIKTYQH